MNPPYIPEIGDIVKMSFDPQSGHEQKGWRPGLVLSSARFNELTGMAFICPITSTNRQIPLHVILPPGMKTSGVVMVDHVKSLDFRQRKAKLIEKSPMEVAAISKNILVAILNDQ